MRCELSLLQALVRLSRNGVRTGEDALTRSSEGRSLGAPSAVRDALRCLERGGFVTRSAEDVRLTFAGLALAVAFAPTERSGHRVAAPARRAKKLGGPVGPRPSDAAHRAA